MGFPNPFPGLRFAVGNGGPAQNTPMAPAPDDGRTPYTGMIGADQYNQAGNVNNNANPANGAMLGPAGPTAGGWSGPVPYGGISQLGSVTNGTYSGYYQPATPGYVPNHYDPYAEDPSGRPNSGPNGPLPSGPMGLPAGPVAAPHAHEPARAPGSVWGGGFGLSDNSAWGNKGDAALLSRSGVNGSLKDTTNQAGTMAARPNGTLPGAGSAFGLGGRP